MILKCLISCFVEANEIRSFKGLSVVNYKVILTGLVLHWISVDFHYLVLSLVGYDVNIVLEEGLVNSNKKSIF